MPTNPDSLASIRVRKLTPGDDRSSFRSGDVDLDRFFSRYAGQNQFRHHVGTTYVAVDSRGDIKGFATVAASELAPRTITSVRRSRLPGYPLPVLRLARLAAAESSQGHGVGALLLRAVFALAQTMSSEIGCVGVVVDAKPDAISFYAKLGFVPLEAEAGELGDRPAPRPMFLEIGQIGSGSHP